MSTGDPRAPARGPRSWNRSELMRVVRFCQVGATNTAITLAVYAALVRLGLPAWIASALAFAAGAVNGYHWNSRWTFADRRSGGGATRLRYVAVQGAGSAASALGVTVAQDALGLAHLPAEIVILPLVTAMTYTLMRSLVFPRGRAQDAPASA